MAQYTANPLPKTRARSKPIASSSTDPPHKETGSLQQPYMLDSSMETGEEIGRGAYGVVYKIRRWGTVCAAKKLHDLPLHMQQLQSSASSSNLEKGGLVVEGDGGEQPAPRKPATHMSSPVVGLVRGSKRIGGQHSSSLYSRGGGGKSGSSANQQAACGGGGGGGGGGRNTSQTQTTQTQTRRADILAKFEKECLLLSNLRHPYIVQFLGVYIEKTSSNPIILMEYLPNSLSNLVKSKPNIPRYLQISILSNVALGLAYLHGHNPSIIHRDLTANNVLLTSNMVAKIADLGVARILDLNPKAAMQLTQAPGTAAYMPPESLATNPCYNTKMDVFSFGVLSLHLVSQMWPIPTESVRVIGGKLHPVSEIDRRKIQFDLMSPDHCIYQLTTQCLQNDPLQRPPISKVMFTLEALQSKFPLPSTSYLDLLQVLENNRNQLEAKGMQIATNKEQIHKFSIKMDSKSQEISSLKENVRKLEKQLVSNVKSQFISAEMAFKSEGDTNGESYLTHTNSTIPSSSSFSPPFLVPSHSSFIWRRDADLPIGIFGSKGIFLEDRLFLGGGDCKDMNSERVVYEYDINGIVRKWTALPAAPVVYFAMATVNRMLTLIGGMDVGKKTATNQLNSWSKESQRWTTALPPMQTARQDCSAETHRNWLLVAGGMNYKKPIYNVELLDISSLQWHTMHTLPKPSVGMTSCIIKNTWFLLGGTNFTEPLKGESGPKEYVFSLVLDENIATNKWNSLPDTPLYCCTAVPFGDHLVAVGGTDSLTSRTFNPSMFMFSPANEKWLYVGNMPTHRSQVTCVVLAKDRLAVLGGQDRCAKYSRTVEILRC